MKKMKTTLIIIGGIAFLACAYYYHKNKQKAVASKTPEEALEDFLQDPEIELEEVEQLSMEDVVAYFKGLQLKNGKDIPYIAQTTREGRKMYMLGTYNEDNIEIANYKFIVPDVVTEDFLSAIGEEKMIVLN